jgi:Amt family ammonium transporter
MAGVFASDQLGIFSGQGLAEGVTMADQVWVQFIGVVATAVYTALATWLILKVVAMMTDGLRVTLDEETEGLDIASHEERGYDL